MYLRLFIPLLTLCVFFVGCQPKSVGKGPWIKKMDSEAMSTLIINFSTKMKIDKHLELEDSWTAYDDTIQKVCLRYSSQRLLTVYDARLIMVEVVEDFLERLNNNEILFPQLEHFPFTASDLDVRINFESYYGRYIDELYIGQAWLYQGCVYYYAFDRKDLSENGIDWDHHRFEPYTKSRELALIKKQADLPFTEKESPALKNLERARAYERYFAPTL